MDGVSFAEWVFYLEGLLNIFSGFLLTFFPAFCMATQGLLATSTLANANLSQFGSLVLLLGVVGVRCTPSPPLIEALLLGDFIWMAGLKYRRIFIENFVVF